MLPFKSSWFSNFWQPIKACEQPANVLITALSAFFFFFAGSCDVVSKPKVPKPLQLVDSMFVPELIGVDDLSGRWWGAQEGIDAAFRRWSPLLLITLAGWQAYDNPGEHNSLAKFDPTPGQRKNALIVFLKNLLYDPCLSPRSGLIFPPKLKEQQNVIYKEGKLFLFQICTAVKNCVHFSVVALKQYPLCQYKNLTNFCHI